jgi:penicillin-binding protein 1C
MMEPKHRTLTNKIVEAFRALQLEHLKSKDEILEMYLNMAPYGGNIRGVEAAAAMCFGRGANELTIAEAAMLAGVCKSPTRCDPRRHPEEALKRQKEVLRRMLANEYISQAQYEEAVSTKTVVNAAARRRHAVHAAWMAMSRRRQGGQTCIDLQIQREVERAAREHMANLPLETDLAIVVIDIEDSAIVAMVGSADSTDPVDGQVNGALARRSPGSALKPFIYAAAFESGRLSPESTVYDMPVNMGGWEPENFDRTFRGKTTAAEALRRSLNSPALQIARGIGVSRCYNTVESVGIRIPPNARERAYLALTVGGVEVSLLDLTNAYACLGAGGVYSKARLFADEQVGNKQVLSANVCLAISHVLSSCNRRPRGMEGLVPSEIPWFMWKTGTSSGRRDAWAVGHNGRYAIGVWVGRFRGTGRVEYVGAEAAEPLLGRLFSLSPIRNDVAPEANKPIAVTTPLPLPSTIREKLQIVQPADGGVYVAFGGTITIRHKANAAEGLTWFLNGRMLDKGAARETLDVSPGRYRLLCVDKEGRSSAVDFCVK